MTKHELINDIADAVGVSKAQAQACLDHLAATARAELGRKGCGEFVVPGLVKLRARKRPARMARNPKDGSPVEVPAKVVVKFTECWSTT